jgi:UDP-GlcNAc:undecaprenyl-phosphate/decaprenyl-phosphate GlcNAc-1-phosphate transferase
MSLLLIISCTFLLGLALTAAVRKLALRAGLVARPRHDRWHRKPTALMGGVAIYATFLAGYAVFAPAIPAAWPILGAGTLLFITGLIDDFIQIKPYTKLVVQLAAACSAVYFGVRLEWTGSETLNYGLTILWLVGITNAINLLDNMDGLAGGVALIACVFLAVTFLLNGQPVEALLPVLLASAVAGFLVFNFNPASIFMGDCGSMFLGFMLGGASLLSYGRSRNLAAVLITPVLILMMPIFDTSVVTIARKLSGRPISRGGRDHTSHRLVALGMTERRAVLMLYLFAASSGGLAMTVRFLSSELVLLLVAGFALVILFLGLYLGKVRIYEGGDHGAGGTVLRGLVDFTYKRRVFEVLLDLVLAAMAYYSAYLLRWDAEMPAEQLAIFIKTLPLVAIIEIIILLAGGVYRGIWRYTGVDDLIVIARSVALGAAASAGVIFFIYHLRGPSRGVFVLNALLLFVYLCASRLSFRLIGAMVLGRAARVNSGARPVLIYGADDAGELLIREILNNPDHLYKPIAFIDDDRRKEGKVIHGYQIFASSDLQDLMRRHNVNDVLVSSLVSEVSLDRLRDLGISLKRMSIHIE